jgi:hypothetical protein
MASGNSASYGDIIHVLGWPRCGLCCVKKKAQKRKASDLKLIGYMFTQPNQCDANLSILKLTQCIHGKW